MDYHSRMLEDLILMHRYLYYVECAPVISDSAYDKLERDALERLPATSPVHEVGSSLPDSYEARIVELALKELA